MKARAMIAVSVTGIRRWVAALPIVVALLAIHP